MSVIPADSTAYQKRTLLRTRLRHEQTLGRSGRPSTCGKVLSKPAALSFMTVLLDRCPRQRLENRTGSERSAKRERRRLVATTSHARSQMPNDHNSEDSARNHGRADGLSRLKR